MGVFSPPAKPALKGHEPLGQTGVPLSIRQPRYAMLNRWVKEGEAPLSEGAGLLPDHPQPLRSERHPRRFSGRRPCDSFNGEGMKEKELSKARRLNGLAARHRESLARQALAWVLESPDVNSVTIVVNRPLYPFERVSRSEAHPSPTARRPTSAPSWRDDASIKEVSPNGSGQKKSAPRAI